MKWSKSVALSVEILAAHPLRTMLSTLGIIVGVSAVILMVSAGKGAEERILGRIRQMGTNLITVSAGQTKIIAGRQRQMSTVTTLKVEDAVAIQADCPAVALASPAITKKFATRWESENANTTVLGITPQGFPIRNIGIASGRVFDQNECRGRRRVAVLGPTVVENLFLGADPIGLTFRVGRVPFEVIGVTEPKGIDGNGLDQDDVVIIPLDTAMRRVMNVDFVQTIYVQGNSSGELAQAENEIRERLRQRHRLDDKPDDFTIQNQAVLLETERETAQAMTLLIGSVSGISLMVGGVGILAVMLISVRERTPEIGLRRAVGARRCDIRNQFLLESGMLAGLGGLMGVAMGVGGARIIGSLGYVDMVVSWPAAAIGVVFSVSLGVAFGLYPAVRAASLEPIDALRAE
ncbi:Macrolide export ATP-binding/permease protein MacB [Novipirellula aureliae]|uniref:Macrolide export ATP-binding/permease protein MacB n=1 Tax=Novipirellula aureliae TaxID=2527966 RepID=A0A5C6DQA9_9BACT|nr:ABC transporter permease [Novipirellula aureliae]TWU37831.1 Macrolide export ATP-binding/permease protein MacB [Novipirellula aureliae]